METNLKKALGQGVVNVTFRKTDGTIRKMRATTDQRLFTANIVGTDRARAEGVTVVYDLERKDWRSFRDDSVMEWAPA